MKQLQCNFTTPEQSKRLLELGVPADSADLFHDNYFLELDSNIQPCVIYPTHKFSRYNHNVYTPCWSVGRLIEIYHICVGPGCSFTFHVCFPNLMNEIIYKLVEAKSNGWLDLKKLEE